MSDIQDSKMDALLNIYKSPGISSARAVAMVKRILGPIAKKVGHAGTLDLEAEGVLPILINGATKYANMFFDARKEYSFVVKFGARTSTADASGSMIDSTLHLPSAKECMEVCQYFLGEIEQIPPAFSAIKVNGVPSYKLARQDKICAPLKARSVHIYHLTCLGYNEADATAHYVTECSKGTYVRSLAEDIALKLHSLGFITFLQRTRVGIFTAQAAVNIMDCSNMESKEEARQLLQDKCLRLEDFLASS